MDLLALVLLLSIPLVAIAAVFVAFITGDLARQMLPEACTKCGAQWRVGHVCSSANLHSRVPMGEGAAYDGSGGGSIS